MIKFVNLCWFKRRATISLNQYHNLLIMMHCKSEICTTQFYARLAPEKCTFHFCRVSMRGTCWIHSHSLAWTSCRLVPATWVCKCPLPSTCSSADLCAQRHFCMWCCLYIYPGESKGLFSLLHSNFFLVAVCWASFIFWNCEPFRARYLNFSINCFENFCWKVVII